MAIAKNQRKAQARIVRDGPYTIALLTVPNLDGTKGTIEITRVAKYNPNDSSPEYLGKKMIRRIRSQNPKIILTTKERAEIKKDVKTLDYNPAFGAHIALNRAVKWYNGQLIQITATTKNITRKEAIKELTTATKLLNIADIEVNDPVNTPTQEVAQ